MEVSVCCETSVLQIQCPHCEHREDDPYELVQGDSVQALVCGACARTFYLALMNCLACGHEWQFGWRHAPALVEFHQLICGQCSMPYPDHEAHTLSNDLVA